MEFKEYFFEAGESDRSTEYLVLIIYDIVDNKKRNRLATFLNGYGNRVQKSAFEAKLSKRKYEKLIREIPKFCDRTEDSIRVYKIIGKGQIKSWGIGDLEEQEDVILI